MLNKAFRKNCTNINATHKKTINKGITITYLKVAKLQFSKCI